MLSTLDNSSRYFPGIFQVLRSGFQVLAFSSRYFGFFGKVRNTWKIPGKCRKKWNTWEKSPKFCRYLPGIFQVLRICVSVSRYLLFFFQVLRTFFFECAIPGKYLEKGKKCGIPGKNRQYFAGIFQFFSFSRYWLFLSGISHFLPFLTAEYLERKGQYLEKVNTWKKAKKSSKFYRYYQIHITSNTT